MTEKNQIGNKIRQIRESQEMSVEKLAQASNTSTELIVQLEKGALVPSLTPLLQIARALGVRLGTFLDDATSTSPVVVNATNTKNVVRFSGNCDKNDAGSTLDFFSLAAEKADRHMEPFLIDVHPPKSDKVELSSHEGEEFIFVIKGEIEIIYGKNKYKMLAGDSIYYDSIVAHHVHAVGADAQILAVIYTPF